MTSETPAEPATAFGPDDAFDVAQVVLHERRCRDRSWWQPMRECFWPDSTVRLSWYDGDGAGFVTGSEAMTARGVVTTHQIFAPVVDIHRDRAHVEASAAVRASVLVDDVVGDLVSYTRLNYRLERRDGRWRILSLDSIYERATITPSVPGQRIEIPTSDLTSFRASYALLAWDASRHGRSMNDALLGDDLPEPVADFYAQIAAWLASDDATHLQETT